MILGSHRRAEAAIVPIGLYQKQIAGGMKSPMTQPTLMRLRDRKRLIVRLAELNNIRAVAVFGSVAAGTDTESSDIDLLVDPTAEASLFDLAQFALDMEQLTGCPVDVVSRRSLDAEIDASILAEAIPL